MSVNDYFNWEAVKAKSPFRAKYASLEDAIKSCGDLWELFCLWQIAQMCEINPESSLPYLDLAKCPKLSSSDKFEHSLRSSFCPDGLLRKEAKLEVPVRSFCPDGFLDKDGKPKVPVLFICRESNISDNIDNDTSELEPVDKQVFWLREVVRCKEKDRSNYFPDRESPRATEKTAQTKYYNCLKKLLCDLNKQGLIDENVEPSNCAYLNINKRGGFSSCDQSKLAVYAERYQLFIQREIELIKPKTIVVCGELKNQCLQNTLEEIFRSCEKQEYWVYPKHPSRYTKDVVPKEVKLSKKE